MLLVYREPPTNYPSRSRVAFPFRYFHFQQPKMSPTLSIDAEALDNVLLNAKGRRLRRPSQGSYLTCLFSACSTSVSHLSDKKRTYVPKCGLPLPIECTQQRCCVTGLSWASPHPFLYIWGLTELFCPKNDCWIKLGQFAAQKSPSFRIDFGAC
jgi:hypothetical protein